MSNVLPVVAAIVKLAQTKRKGDPPKSTKLRGYLTISDTDRGVWGHVDLPQAFVHGAYHLLKRTGVPCDKPEHPGHITGFLNSEIPKIKKKVGSDDWKAQAGHGKSFDFTITGLKEVDPDGWREMDKVWFLTCRSPELEAHREKLGLTPLVNGHDFHITVAVRRKGKAYKVKAAAAVVKLLKEKKDGGAISAG